MYTEDFSIQASASTDSFVEGKLQIYVLESSLFIDLF